MLQGQNSWLLAEIPTPQSGMMQQLTLLCALCSSHHSPFAHVVIKASSFLSCVTRVIGQERLSRFWCFTLGLLQQPSSSSSFFKTNLQVAFTKKTNHRHFSCLYQDIRMQNNNHGFHDGQIHSIYNYYCLVTISQGFNKNTQHLPRLDFESNAKYWSRLRRFTGSHQSVS